MTRDTLFYVTSYPDHLNAHIPETSVVQPRQKPGERPYFRVHDLRQNLIPNVQSVALPDFFKGWEYWRCDWTPENMSQLGYDFEYDLDEEYVKEVPDIWSLGSLFVCADARNAIEEIAPNTCLFFKAKMFSKQTGKRLDLDRWVMFVRHWLLATGQSGIPDGLNFSISKYDAYQYSQMQSSQHIQSFLNRLGIFCRGKSMHEPIYSAEVFERLRALGFSGLKEKTKQNNLLHDFREVITHVYDVHQK